LTGINGIKLQELVIHQLVDEGTATLLQGDNNFALRAESLLQLDDPVGDGFGFMFNYPVIGLRRISGRTEDDVVFVIGPVDSDPGVDCSCI
jgi:hypothetical protein